MRALLLLGAQRGFQTHALSGVSELRDEGNDARDHTQNQLQGGGPAGMQHRGHTRGVHAIFFMIFPHSGVKTNGMDARLCYFLVAKSPVHQNQQRSMRNTPHNWDRTEGGFKHGHTPEGIAFSLLPQASGNTTASVTVTPLPLRSISLS